MKSDHVSCLKLSDGFLSHLKFIRLEGAGSGELVFHGDRVSVWENEKVLEMDGGDGGTTM